VAQSMMTGVILVALGIIMFVLALPRQGQVVGFLRGRDGMQSFYMMLIILFVFLGLVITLSNL
jgi:hypothetical protein